MISREFSVAIEHLQLSRVQAAKFLCVEVTTVDAYCDGSKGVPQSLAMLLRVAAGLGGIDKLEIMDTRGRHKLVETRARMARR